MSGSPLSFMHYTSKGVIGSPLDKGNEWFAPKFYALHIQRSEWVALDKLNEWVAPNIMVYYYTLILLHI